MAKTLLEYADWLDARNFIWPEVPQPVPVKATPYLKPLPGIRAVVWSAYGTLLRITDGQLMFLHPQQLRMQVALEKTIEEFNMWNSMSRKPGAPWEYMLQQYKGILEDQQMAGASRKGDFPEVDASTLWAKLLGRLKQNGYEYDEAIYGGWDELSEKVAFFFHSRLQGVEASPHALRALLDVSRAGVAQGLLADGQCFTLVQMLRALRSQGTLPPLSDVFAADGLTLSHREGVRIPSRSLYLACLKRFRALGVAADEILYVGSRLRDDLAVARQVGMRTALYAAEKVGLQVASADMKDPHVKPDRLLTDLGQIGDILSQ
jgi:FMN phosphatase YigB (HAD superfamily)